MKKLLPLAGATLALALVLTGCSSSADPEPSKAPSPVQTTEPDADGDTGSDGAETDEAVAGETVRITYTALGEKQEDGEYSHFPVEIDVKVASIDAISQAEHDELMNEANEDSKSTLAAFDYYKVLVEETYVSGDDPAHQASYTSYDPVTESGAKLNSLPIIGFDWCKSSAFSKDFINGETNTSCVLAAVAKGEPAPAGVRYAQYDTDYDPSNGTPAVILM